MDYINIQEVAKKLNVSHTTIYNKLKNKEINKLLKPYMKKMNNVRYLNLEGIEILKDTIAVKDNKEKKNNTNSVKPFISNDESMLLNLKGTLLDSLNERIIQLEKDKEYLKDQIDLKDKHIETQARLIENSQILLRDQKLLMESKTNWWKFWKKKD